MNIPLFMLVRTEQKQNKQMYMEVFSQIIFLQFRHRCPFPWRSLAVRWKLNAVLKVKCLLSTNTLVVDGIMCMMGGIMQAENSVSIRRLFSLYRVRWAFQSLFQCSFLVKLCKFGSSLWRRGTVLDIRHVFWMLDVWVFK